LSVVKWILAFPVALFLLLYVIAGALPDGSPSDGSAADDGKVREAYFDAPVITDAQGLAVRLGIDKWELFKELGGESINGKTKGVSDTLYECWNYPITGTGVHDGGLVVAEEWRFCFDFDGLLKEKTHLTEAEAAAG
jgi:hypothetical protein